MFSSILDTPFFEGIKDVNEDFVLPMFKEKRLRKEQVLFDQGDLAAEMYIVKSGSLQIYREDEGRVIVLGHQFPGQMIGELEAVHENKERLASVSALEKTVLWKIEQKDLDKLLDLYPVLLRRMFYVVSDRLSQADRKIEYLAFLDSRVRVSNLLLDLLANFGIPVEDGIKIEWRITHQYFSQMIGTGREAVTRALLELRQEGLIRTEARKIVVLDLERLRKQAGGEAEPTETRRWHSQHKYDT
ncbi:Crp/Fnr family transcriptional regulator [Saccharibacillus qingshengii]|uniref:Crp/Fnr family transcriptional regulator n=1 Tax=Saccharibacillus qingshengii TaxID=1763540 RepID=UPI001554B04D|nr:Crp/Fnr family transcriptional regulator [Saccharibacillus qingshengii]